MTSIQKFIQIFLLLLVILFIIYAVYTIQNCEGMPYEEYLKLVTAEEKEDICFSTGLDDQFYENMVDGMSVSW